MPITRRNNNRVMPQNHGSVGVARTAIQDLIPVQRERYQNAFRVDGYLGILYVALRAGIRCHCMSRATSLRSRLNTDGTARPGFLDEMTLGAAVRLQPYNAQTVNVTTPTGVANSQENFDDDVVVITATGYSLSQPLTTNITPVNTPEFSSPMQQIVRTGNSALLSPMNDDLTSDYQSDPQRIVTQSGYGDGGPMNDIDLEDIPINGEWGLTDAGTSACPVCMGKGYVGGFAVDRGFRTVFNFQYPDADLGDAQVDLTMQVPSISATRSSYLVTLPAGTLTIEAVKLWNNMTPAQGTISVDGVVLRHQNDLLQFCDGRRHTIAVTNCLEYTHLELQGHQAYPEPMWALPQLTKSGSKDKLDGIEDFDVNISPMIGHLHPGDVIADMHYGKFLNVGSIPMKSERSRAVLGWTASVRVVQPQELVTLLPRLRPVPARAPTSPRQARRPHDVR